MTTAEIIAHLVELAKEMRDQADRGDELSLGDDELAFCDAVVQNDAAVVERGDDQLKLIALELVRLSRQEVTIDWSVREQVRAKNRTQVKRVVGEIRRMSAGEIARARSEYAAFRRSRRR